MRTKFVVMVILSAVLLALLGSAYVAVRVVSANNSIIPGFPAFKNNGYTLAANWFNQFYPDTAALLGVGNCSPRDKYGVCMVDINGKFYNHPVLQAEDGLYSLTIYSENGSSAYLKRAEAEANRILSYKTVYDHAWWYPYKFNFEEYGLSADTAIAPWYSAMSQGEILDLFTQLYKVTGVASWKADAGRTFTSFIDPWTTSKGEKPWVDTVDSSGHLWLEEYPTPNRADDVINGADFAIWGLVDYANEFHNSQAAYLASGALTTMLHAIGLVRHPGWIVGYSLSHPTDESTAYHAIVTEQFLTFAEITGNRAFATLALELASDFPIYRVKGAMTIVAGPHQMAHANGKTLQVTSVSTIKVPANTTANIVARVKLAHEPGFWYEVASSSGNALPSVVSIDQVGMLPTKPSASSGPYAGLYIREQAHIAYYPGICNQLDFNPSLPATFPVGSYPLYASNGQVLTQINSLTLTSPEIIPVSHLETIGGITVWAISSGTYDGDFLAGQKPTKV